MEGSGGKLLSSVDVYLNQMGRFRQLDHVQESSLCWRIHHCQRRLQTQLLGFPVAVLGLAGLGGNDISLTENLDLSQLCLCNHQKSKPWFAGLAQTGDDIGIDGLAALLGTGNEGIDPRLISSLDDLVLPAERLEKLAVMLIDGLKTGNRDVVLAGVADPDSASLRLAQAYNDWRQGIEHLVQANLRLVVHHAQRYRRQRDTQLLDLIQEGNLGLLRAARKFNVRMGCRFSTYASYWIHMFIDRVAVRLEGPVQRPIRVDNLMRKFRAIRSDSRPASQSSPAVADFLSETGISKDLLDSWLRLEQKALSIEGGLEEGNKVLTEQLSATDEQLWRPIQAEQLRQALSEGLKCLSRREMEILEKRFGIGGRDPVTLQVVADHYGLSRERVRQIESAALKKLRVRFGQRWQQFLD